MWPTVVQCCCGNLIGIYLPSYHHPSLEFLEDTSYNRTSGALINLWCYRGQVGSEPAKPGSELEPKAVQVQPLQ